MFRKRLYRLNMKFRSLFLGPAADNAPEPVTLQDLILDLRGCLPPLVFPLLAFPFVRFSESYEFLSFFY